MYVHFSIGTDPPNYTAPHPKSSLHTRTLNITFCVCRDVRSAMLGALRGDGKQHKVVPEELQDVEQES
jgi:hypothetical protein